MYEFLQSPLGALRKHAPVVVSVLLVLGASFALGFYAGVDRTHRNSDDVRDLLNTSKPIASGASGREKVDFETFWKAWTILEDKFVGNTTTPDQYRVYGAISGLADSMGDPYTVFFPPVENTSFKEAISGNFEGVGMEMGLVEKNITVISPLKGNPAERAGIKSGDVIWKIDDKSTANMKVEDAVALIRGKKGTSVRLTISRKGTEEPIVVSIVRDTITVPAVATEMRPDKIFTIRVNTFSAVAAGQFREGLREFVVSGSDKLIIDLRGNPGGYLEAAVEMASWFLPQGAVVVSEDRGKNGPGETLRSRGYNIFGPGLKMVILVDGGSASASEILAGALREHNKATLVGMKTFGKGSVQELVELDDKTALKVTIARWLTPNGHSISNNGIEPDIKVDFTEEDAKKRQDPQLERAVVFLLTGK
jgi:carboxyl-terminal processing protease